MPTQPKKLSLSSDVDLVAWLHENDPRPKIIPDWINSKHLTLVVLIENRGKPTEPIVYEAFIASDEEALRALVRLRQDPRRRLIFQVSREALETACPGCTAGCD